MTVEIILCDTHAPVIKAWRQAFAGHSDVEIYHGSIVDVSADAYVSPANGFGIMDGGIDIVLRDRFPLVESRVQDAIADLGEPLHVGMCLTIETGDLDVPYLLFAPTMLFPSVVAHTNNAHRAMLAILEEAAEQSIGSVAIPGLCTGVGSMHPDDAATQMAAAYTFWLAHAQ